MNKKNMVFLVAVAVLVVIALALSIRSCGDNVGDTKIPEPSVTEMAGQQNENPTTNNPDGMENAAPTNAEATSAESTEPTATTPDETEPEQTTAATEATEVTIPANPKEVDYEEYMALSADQQEAFMESFDTMDDFVAWLKEAKKAYQEAQDDAIIVDGKTPIDMGEIAG